MSTRGERIVVRGPPRSAPAGPSDESGEPRAASTPYWLLWSASIAAAVVCVAAFLLWGFGGAATLFDMIVALCS
jgi:hypothetical protein